jgi:hypothetical protein
MTKSIITNSRDLLNAIAKMEREMNGISDNIRNLKSAKATINQPTNNQLLTWDSEISMVEDSLWQLPAADGAANEIMYTDGAGNLAWIAPGAAAVAGADTQVQYNAGGVMAAEAAFTYNYGTNTLTTDHIQATIDFAPSAADGASLGTAALEFSDLYLADGGIIYLGDDQDVTLIHIADTGIRINSTMQLQFRDAAIYIASLNDGHLDLEADTQIDLNSAVYLDVCVDAGADVDAFLVRDAGGFIDYRTGVEVRSDIDAAPAAHGVTTNYMPYASSATTFNETILRYNSATENFRIGGAPSANVKFYLNWYPSNLTAYGFYSIVGSIISVAGNYDSIAMYFQAQNVGSTQNNTGSLVGLYGGSYHSVSINQGNVYGGFIRYGTTGNVANVTGSVRGLNLEPYAGGTGTIADFYDIYINDFVSSGATVLNDWCIYSLHAAPSRLIHDLQIDSDSYGIVLGDGQDAKIYYDGSNLIYNSIVVGAGAHAFTGTVRLNTCADAGTDTNKILVRDAANNIDYRTGAELLADLSGDAAASFDWNSQELDNVGWLGINTTADPNRYINIDDAALSFTSTFYGIYQNLVKTAGASDANDLFNGIYNYTSLNQNAGTIGYVRSIYNEFQFDDGNVGDAANSRYAMVSYNIADLNAGKIWGPVYCGYFNIDQQAGNEITGNVYGIQIFADLDGTVGGISYMLYLDEANGIDYGIYQNGTAQNRLGGILDIWSSAKTIFLGADEGLNTRTDNTNKRCHIQCTQYDTDADGMAILATLCNVGQNLLLIGSRGSVTGNAPTAIYFYTSANTTAGGGAAALGIESDGGVYLYIVKSGATQAAAGASAGEIWETSGHASLPDHVLMLGA